MRIIASSSTKALKAQGACTNVFQTLEDNDRQARLLYLAKLSVIMERKITPLMIKSRLKEFMTSKVTL